MPQPRYTDDGEGYFHDEEWQTVLDSIIGGNLLTGRTSTRRLDWPPNSPSGPVPMRRPTPNQALQQNPPHRLFLTLRPLRRSR